MELVLFEGLSLVGNQLMAGDAVLIIHCFLQVISANVVEQLICRERRGETTRMAFDYRTNFAGRFALQVIRLLSAS